MKSLVLYANYSSTSSYYDDWHDAFLTDSFFETDSCDICSVNKNKLLYEIKSYEFIILLHSVTSDSLSYIAGIVDILNERKGILATFVGNEVNIPGAYIKDKIHLFKKLRPNFIFTQLLEETGQWLYEECKESKVIAIPHALNAKAFYPTQVFHKRPIDIGVRSFKYNVHLGDQDRNTFFTHISNDLANSGLIGDISVDPTKRFNRQQWACFLNQCKSTIATEAGSFYLQKNDKMILEIQEYLFQKREKEGGLTIQKESATYKIYLKLPKKVKEFLQSFYYRYAQQFNIKYEYLLSEETLFDEILQNIIQYHDKCHFYSKAISSRHFDAIGTKTVLIMLEGRYNDILLPGEHYLEIKKDFSNFNDILEQFKDFDQMEKLTSNTLDYILSFHQYHHRINKIKSLLV